MTHRFSWRLGLAVIVILVGAFVLCYTRWSQSHGLLIRQTTEIRSADGDNSATARAAIQEDLAK